MSLEPTEIDAPPVMAAPPVINDEAPSLPAWEPHATGKAKKSGPLAGLLALLAFLGKYLLGLGKVILPALKFLKLGKVLLTGGTMILSVWFYALIFGWPFAVGFVLCIFVHEMGHVLMAAREGLPVTAPIFIPGMGALILAKRHGRSAWSDALIGIGGPAAGAISALACWGLYSVTGNPLFLALAMTAFLINLFNMMPVMPLDGGWITGAVSPYLWALGLIGIIYLSVSGWMTNPFVWVLVILALPRLWQGLRTGSVAKPGEVLTLTQKLTMGAAYVGLSIFLLWGNMATSDRLRAAHPIRTQSHISRSAVQ